MTMVQMADTLFLSANNLSTVDRGRVLDFVSKLHQNPKQPGLSMERLDRARDPKLWSARITQDLRAILHRDADNYIVLYASHHDDAYAWAERRKVEQNAVTGALQVVEAAETVVNELQPAPPTLSTPALFAAWSDDVLLGLGVPPDWLPAVRQLSTEDDLMAITDHLPAEAAEGLLELHTSGNVPAVRHTPDLPPEGHPDTRRRFFVYERDDELQRMLEAPLALWVAFLHPSQQRLVTGHFNGPVKATGSAGTGKTVVAMHRARELARQGKRVLLTSYVNTLCQNIEQNLGLLCSDAERARITVGTVHSQALALIKGVEPVRPPASDEIEKQIERYAALTSCPFNVSTLLAEWRSVVQTQGIDAWEAYRGASRAGRGRPLNARERKQMWEVFEGVRNWCAAQSPPVRDWPDLCRRARELLEAGQAMRPYDAVIVDEVQDLGPQELRLLATLAGEGPDRLMLVGDDGQRIYERAFSLRALGIDVRGRSHVLRINYRTTEQIRRFADAMLHEGVSDLDGGKEDRRCRSLLSGPLPAARGFTITVDEHAWVAEQIARALAGGLRADEIAVFARTNKHADAAKTALAASGLPVRALHLKPSARVGPAVCVGTMHRAKGLEYKVVFAVAVSEDVLPHPSALEHSDDPQDRAEALVQERQLLYVTLTRARDELFISWVGEPSPFLAAALTAPGATCTLQAGGVR